MKTDYSTQAKWTHRRYRRAEWRDPKEVLRERFGPWPFEGPDPEPDAVPWNARPPELEVPGSAGLLPEEYEELERRGQEVLRLIALQERRYAGPEVVVCGFADSFHCIRRMIEAAWAAHEAEVRDRRTEADYFYLAQRWKRYRRDPIFSGATQ